MKNLIIIAIVAAAVTFILAVITQLVGHSLIVSANAWNSITHTFLLFGIILGVLELLKKKE